MAEPSNQEAQPLPLEGVRVIDFSQTLAGPFCTWLLSCLGADVIKIEPPQGDYLRAAKRGTVFAATNRNKRSVVLDLGTERGRDLAHRMIRKIDVLVESFRPGTMARLELSYERVRELNPNIIYASVSGYGQDGPYAGRPGYDPLAQALSGIMAATGYPDRGPVRVGTSIIDYGTGVYTALAVTAALARRERSHTGCRIDACLLETSMSYMSQHYTHFSATGELPVRRGTANDSFVPFQMFEVKDGEVFVGAGTDRMFQDLCHAFGLETLAADESLRTIQGRCEHSVEVVDAVAKVLKMLTRDDVVNRLLAAGVPTADVLSVNQTMENPQVRARRAILQLEDQHLGQIAVTPFPVVMGGVVRDAGTPAPSLGQHTDEVLREFGLEEPHGL